VSLNAKLFGLSTTALVVPYLHSTQSPFSTAIGAYDGLEYSIAKGIFPLLVLGVIFLTASTVGKLFCGWACPFGMVQDFLSYLPVKKQRISQSTSSSLKDVKWAVLGFSILSTIVVSYRRGTNLDETPFGIFSDSPFSVLSPSSTLFTYIPWMVMWKPNVLATIGGMGWLKMAILLMVLVPSAYIPRFFCRFFCPLGALFEPLSKFKTLKIMRSKAPKEELNRLLADVCPTGVQVGDADFIDSPQCIHCGKCVTDSPKNLSQQFF